jgi:transcriptional regulator with XRE-family HTH domain
MHMSTIEPNSQGDVVSPLIGARILEIMEEKGKAFTRQAIANRLYMKRDTLSKKLMGERTLYRFELQRIAEALDVT